MVIKNESENSKNTALHVEAYEYFAGGDERDKRLDDFIKGHTTHLNLDYPLLDDDNEIKRIYNNNSIAAWSLEGSASVSNEVELAQAALVMQAAAARRIILQGKKDQLKKVEDRLLLINAELFGAPDEQLVLSSKKAIFSKINSRSYSGTSAKLFNDLVNGFIFRGEDGAVVQVKPFLNAEELSFTDTVPDLPRLSTDTLVKLHEKIMTEFGYARQIIEAYWNENVLKRPEGERSINPRDALVLLNECIANYKNTPSAGAIKVEYSENSSATSWSSEKNAVVVAGKRKPFKSIDEFFGVFVHEFGVHARRWMNGSKSDLPELSKGVYTKNDRGELVDYLTFEEGLATIMQKAAVNKNEDWKLDSLSLYMVAGLAQEGRSDREIYEILLRLRLLSDLKKQNDAITDNQWSSASKKTLNSVVRLFRGMPSSEDGRQQVVYLKDMAYLNGRVKAINYLNNISRNNEDWDSNYDRLFMGKIDNSEQSHLL